MSDAYTDPNIGETEEFTDEPSITPFQPHQTWDEWNESRGIPTDTPINTVREYGQHVKDWYINSEEGFDPSRAQAVDEALLVLADENGFLGQTEQERETNINALLGPGADNQERMTGIVTEQLGEYMGTQFADLDPEDERYTGTYNEALTEMVDSGAVPFATLRSHDGKERQIIGGPASRINFFTAFKDSVNRGTVSYSDLPFLYQKFHTLNEEGLNGFEIEQQNKFITKLGTALADDNSRAKYALDSAEKELVEMDEGKRTEFSEETESFVRAHLGSTVERLSNGTRNNRDKYDTTNLTRAISILGAMSANNKGKFKYHKKDKDIAKNIRVFGGRAFAHPKLMTHKGLFEKALDGHDELRPDQKALVVADRETFMERRFSHFNKIFSETEATDDDWNNAHSKALANGTSNVELLDEFLADPENYSHFINSWAKFGSSIEEGVVGFFASVGQYFGHEGSREYLLKKARDSARRDEVMRLFGEEWSWYTEAASAVAPMVADAVIAVGATYVTGGVAAPFLVAAKTTGTALTRKGVAKSLSLTLLRQKFKETPKDTAERLWAKGIIKGSSKDVATNGIMPAIEAYNKILSSRILAGTYHRLTWANRSGGNMYTSVYSQLPEDMDHESKHTIALGAAAKAGLSTVLITSAFQKLGFGGFEDALLNKGLTYRQLRESLTRLTGNAEQLGTSAVKKEVLDALSTRMKELGGKFTGILKRRGKDALSEGFEEGLDELVQSFIEAASLNEDRPLMEHINQALMGAKLGAIIGAGATPAMRAARNLLQPERRRALVDRERFEREEIDNIISRLRSSGSSESARELARWANRSENISWLRQSLTKDAREDVTTPPPEQEGTATPVIPDVTPEAEPGQDVPLADRTVVDEEEEWQSPLKDTEFKSTIHKHVDTIIKTYRVSSTTKLSDVLPRLESELIIEDAKEDPNWNISQEGIVYGVFHDGQWVGWPKPTKTDPALTTGEEMQLPEAQAPYPTALDATFGDYSASSPTSAAPLVMPNTKGVGEPGGRGYERVVTDTAPTTPGERRPTDYDIPFGAPGQPEDIRRGSRWEDQNPDYISPKTIEIPLRNIGKNIAELEGSIEALLSNASKRLKVGRSTVERKLSDSAKKRLASLRTKLEDLQLKRAELTAKQVELDLGDVDPEQPTWFPSFFGVSPAEDSNYPPVLVHNLDKDDNIIRTDNNPSGLKQVTRESMFPDADFKDMGTAELAEFEERLSGQLELLRQKWGLPSIEAKEVSELFTSITKEQIENVLDLQNESDALRVQGEFDFGNLAEPDEPQTPPSPPSPPAGTGNPPLGEDGQRLQLPDLVTAANDVHLSNGGIWNPLIHNPSDFRYRATPEGPLKTWNSLSKNDRNTLLSQWNGLNSDFFVEPPYIVDNPELWKNNPAYTLFNDDPLIKAIKDMGGIQTPQAAAAKFGQEAITPEYVLGQETRPSLGLEDPVELFNRKGFSKAKANYEEQFNKRFWGNMPLLRHASHSDIFTDDGVTPYEAFERLMGINDEALQSGHGFIYGWDTKKKKSYPLPSNEWELVNFWDRINAASQDAFFLSKFGQFAVEQAKLGLGNVMTPKEAAISLDDAVSAYGSKLIQINNVVSELQKQLRRGQHAEALTSINKYTEALSDKELAEVIGGIRYKSPTRIYATPWNLESSYIPSKKQAIEAPSGIHSLDKSTYAAYLQRVEKGKLQMQDTGFALNTVLYPAMVQPFTRDSNAVEAINFDQERRFVSDSSFFAGTKRRIPISFLRVGDRVTTSGGVVEVIHIDPETGDVIFDGGTTYGIRTSKTLPDYHDVEQSGLEGKYIIGDIKLGDTPRKDRLSRVGSVSSFGLVQGVKWVGDSHKPIPMERVGSQEYWKSKDNFDPVIDNISGEGNEFVGRGGAEDAKDAIRNNKPLIVNVDEMFTSDRGENVMVDYHGYGKAPSTWADYVKKVPAAIKSDDVAFNRAIRYIRSQQALGDLPKNRKEGRGHLFVSPFKTASGGAIYDPKAKKVSNLSYGEFEEGTPAVGDRQLRRSSDLEDILKKYDALLTHVGYIETKVKGQDLREHDLNMVHIVMPHNPALSRAQFVAEKLVTITQRTNWNPDENQLKRQSAKRNVTLTDKTREYITRGANVIIPVMKFEGQTSGSLYKDILNSADRLSAFNSKGKAGFKDSAYKFKEAPNVSYGITVGDTGGSYTIEEVRNSIKELTSKYNYPELKNARNIHILNASKDTVAQILEGYDPTKADIPIRITSDADYDWQAKLEDNKESIKLDSALKNVTAARRHADDEWNNNLIKRTRDAQILYSPEGAAPEPAEEFPENPDTSYLHNLSGKEGKNPLQPKLLGYIGQETPTRDKQFSTIGIDWESRNKIVDTWMKNNRFQASVLNNEVTSAASANGFTPLFLTQPLGENIPEGGAPYYYAPNRPPFGDMSFFPEGFITTYDKGEIDTLADAIQQDAGAGFTDEAGDRIPMSAMEAKTMAETQHANFDLRNKFYIRHDRKRILEIGDKATTKLALKPHPTYEEFSQSNPEFADLRKYAESIAEKDGNINIENFNKLPASSPMKARVEEYIRSLHEMVARERGVPARTDNQVMVAVEEVAEEEGVVMSVETKRRLTDLIDHAVGADVLYDHLQQSVFAELEGETRPGPSASFTGDRPIRDINLSAKRAADKVMSRLQIDAIIDHRSPANTEQSHITILDRSALKEGHPVTMDDAGVIIPPSQRFTRRPDERFIMTGAKAVTDTPGDTTGMTQHALENSNEDVMPDEVKARRLQLVVSTMVQIAQRNGVPVHVVRSNDPANLRKPAVYKRSGKAHKGLVYINPAGVLRATSDINSDAGLLDIARTLMTHEAAHIAASKAIDAKLFNTIVEETPDYAYEAIIDDYFAGYEGADIQRENMRSALDGNNIEFFGEQMTPGEVKRMLVEEQLRMHAERVLTGYTSEEQVQFLKDNPSWLQLAMNYLKGILKKYLAMYRMHRDSSRFGLATKRLVNEMRAMRNSYGPLVEVDPFDVRNPNSDAMELAAIVGAEDVLLNPEAIKVNYIYDEEKKKEVAEKIPYALVTAPGITKFTKNLPASLLPKRLDQRPDYDNLHYWVTRPQQDLINAAIGSGAVDNAASELVDYVTEMREKYPHIDEALEWYPSVSRMLVERLGEEDAKFFPDLLAATSPNTGVEQNFQFAAEALTAYRQGKFDRHIQRYQEMYAYMEAGELLDVMIQRRMAPAAKLRVMTPKGLATKWIEHYKILPLRPDAKGNMVQYGMNSNLLLKALSRRWASDQMELYVSAKAPQFSKNIEGDFTQATIDVWAARTLRRILYAGKQRKWRIQPQSETGVSNSDFVLGQLIFERAAKQLGMEPANLQAVAWFAEKQVWTDNNWTKGAGETQADFRESFEVFFPAGRKPRPFDHAKNIMTLIQKERLLEPEIYSQAEFDNAPEEVKKTNEYKAEKRKRATHRREYKKATGLAGVPAFRKQRGYDPIRTADERVSKGFNTPGERDFPDTGGGIPVGGEEDVISTVYSTLGGEDYRGIHRAPLRADGGYSSLDAMDAETYPSDLYSTDGARLYGHGGDDTSRDKEIHDLILKVRGKPKAKVTIYRGVPAEAGDEINRGDWVTPDRKYAEDHASRYGDDYKILTKEVQAGELITEGNSLYEYGYDPVPDTLYALTGAYDDYLGGEEALKQKAPDLKVTAEDVVGFIESGKVKPGPKDNIKRGISGKEMVDYLIKETAYPEHAALLKYIRPYVKHTIVKVPRIGNRAPASFSGAAGVHSASISVPIEQSSQLYLRTGMGNWNGITSEVILHELLHAATQGRLVAGRLVVNQGTKLAKATKGLNDLVSVVTDHFRTHGIPEGMVGNQHFPERIDADELLAWGLANTHFQRMLQGVKIEGTQQNAFTKFVELIRELLGIPEDQTTALTELIRLTEDLLTAPKSELTQLRLNKDKVSITGKTIPVDKSDLVYEPTEPTLFSPIGGEPGLVPLPPNLEPQVDYGAFFEDSRKSRLSPEAKVTGLSSGFNTDFHFTTKYQHLLSALGEWDIDGDVKSFKFDEDNIKIARFLEQQLADLAVSLPDRSGTDLNSGRTVDPFSIIKKHFPGGQHKKISKVLKNISDAISTLDKPRFAPRQVFNLVELVQNTGVEVDSKVSDLIAKRQGAEGSFAEEQKKEAGDILALDHPEFFDSTKMRGGATYSRRIPTDTDTLFSPIGGDTRVDGPAIAPHMPYYPGSFSTDKLIYMLAHRGQPLTYQSARDLVHVLRTRPDMSPKELLEHDHPYLTAEDVVELLQPIKFIDGAPEGMSSKDWREIRQGDRWSMGEAPLIGATPGIPSTINATIDEEGNLYIASSIDEETGEPSDSFVPFGDYGYMPPKTLDKVFDTFRSGATEKVDHMQKAIMGAMSIGSAVQTIRKGTVHKQPKKDGNWKPGEGFRKHHERLLLYWQNGGRVFLDNGAFPYFNAHRAIQEALDNNDRELIETYKGKYGEKIVNFVKENPDGFAGKDSYHPLNWDGIMSFYEEWASIAEETNKPYDTLNLTVVAPDIIGNPEGSTELQEKYKDRILGLLDKGVHVIVPAQRPNVAKGKASFADAVKAIAQVFDGDDPTAPTIKRPNFLVGVPSSASVWSEDELIEYVSKEQDADRQTFRLHRLGANDERVRKLGRASDHVIVTGDLTADFINTAITTDEGPKQKEITQEEWKQWEVKGLEYAEFGRMLEEGIGVRSSLYSPMGGQELPGSADASMRGVNTGEKHFSDFMKALDAEIGIRVHPEKSNMLILGGVDEEGAGFLRTGSEVKFSVTNVNKPNAIRIEYISSFTPKKGYAGAALEAITNAADKAGIDLELMAQKVDKRFFGGIAEPGMSTEQLAEWYERNGFVFDPDTRPFGFDGYREFKQQPPEGESATYTYSTLGVESASDEEILNATKFKNVLRLFELPVLHEGDYQAGNIKIPFWRRFFGRPFTFFTGVLDKRIQRLDDQRKFMLNASLSTIKEFHKVLTKQATEAYGPLGEMDSEVIDTISRAIGSTKGATLDRQQVEAIENDGRIKIQEAKRQLDLVVKEAKKKKLSQKQFNKQEPDGDYKAYNTNFNAEMRKLTKDTAEMYKNTQRAVAESMANEKRRLRKAEAERLRVERADAMDKIRNGFRGTTTTYISGAPALADTIDELRKYIDALSVKVKQVYGTNPELQARIDDQLGIYLTRSYRIFAEHDWADKVMSEDSFQQVRQDAAKFFTDEAVRIRATSIFKQVNRRAKKENFDKISMEEAAIMAREEIDLMGEGNESFGERQVRAFVDSYRHNGYMSAQSGKGEGYHPLVDSFRAKKDIPEPLAALLGEYKEDTVFDNMYRTFVNLHTMAANQNFMLQAVQIGRRDGWLLTGDELAEKIAEDPDVYGGGNFVTVRKSAMGKKIKPNTMHDPFMSHTEVENGELKELGPLYAPKSFVEGLASTFEPALMKGAQDEASHIAQKLHGIASKLTGISMGVKTLGSIGFYIRNIVSNMLFFGPSQGFIRWGRMGGELMVETKRWLGKGKDLDAEIAELTALGIVGDELRPSVLKELYMGGETPDSLMQELDTHLSKAQELSRKGKTFVGAAKGKRDEFFDKLQELSRRVDSFYKIAYYKHELAHLKNAQKEAKRKGDVNDKHHHMTEEELKREAARKVLMTAQSYSQAPPFVKGALKSWYGLVFAPFLRFRLEVPRILINSVKLGLEEVSSSNAVIKSRGKKRLTGLVGTVGGLGAVLPYVIAKAYGGLTDEEDEANRASMPSYLRSHTFITFKGGKMWEKLVPGSEGNIISFDMTYLNPYSSMADPFLRALSSLARGKGLGDASSDFVSAMLTNQFLDDQIVSGTVAAMKKNKHPDTDTPIYEETDEFPMVLAKLFRFAFSEAYVPPSMERVLKGTELSKALTGQVGEFDPGMAFLHEFLPTRPHVIEPKKQLERFLRVRGDEMRRARLIKRRMKADDVSDEDIREFARKDRETRMRINRDLLEKFKGFEGMGLSKRDIYLTAKDKNYGKRRLELLNRGYMERPVLSPTFQREMSRLGSEYVRRMRVFQDEVNKMPRYIPLD